MAPGPSGMIPTVDVIIGRQVELVDGVQHIRGTVQLPLPDLAWVFVMLHQGGTDEFYMLRMCDL